MRKINIIFQVLVGAVTLLLAFACTRGGMWGDSHCVDRVEKIRIVAEIAPFQNRLPGPLRATDGRDGKTTEGDNIPFWKKNGEEFEIERRVDHAMLYIYDSHKMVKAIFYHDARLTEGMPQPFKGLEVKAFGTEGKSLTFDTELMPGDYTFLLLVNDKPTIEAARKGQLRDPKMKAKASSLTPSMLGGERKMVNGAWQEPTLMPMVGQQFITVRRLKEGENEPITLAPAINLERVYARIMFTLTTTKDASNAEYINDLVETAQTDPRPYATSPTVDNRKTLGAFVDLVDRKVRQECYMILPLENEWTASIGKLIPFSSRHYAEPEPWMKDISTFNQMLTEQIRLDLDPENSFCDPNSTSFGGHKLKKLYQQMPTYSDGGAQMPYYLYILPMCIKGADNSYKFRDMPYIHIALTFLKRPYLGDKAFYHFRIPIYTRAYGEMHEGYISGDVIENTPDIRRNTNYVIHARLLGEGLEVFIDDGTMVLPFRKVDQEIEIDPYFRP